MIHLSFIPRLSPVPGNEAWHFFHIILHSRIQAGHIQTFSLQMYLTNKYLSLEEASVLQITWASYTVCTSWSNTPALRMHLTRKYSSLTYVQILYMLLMLKHSSLKMLLTCNTWLHKASLAMHMIMQQWQANLCISVSLIPRPLPSFPSNVLQVMGSWARAWERGYIGVTLFTASPMWD